MTIRTLKFIVSLALAAVSLPLFSNTAFATHFRYGSLSWAPTAIPGHVEFRLVIGSRRARFPGQGTAGDGLPQLGDVFNDGHTLFFFGDGAATGVLNFRCTAFSVTEDWVIGEALDPVSGAPVLNHTYEGAGPFLAGINDAARIEPGFLNNRANGQYIVRTLVRPFAPNSSPVSSLVPIVNVPVGSAVTFNVPASDPNGDTLRWRLAYDTFTGFTNYLVTQGIANLGNTGIATTFGEPGTCCGPANFTVNAASGLVTWNNVGLDATRFWTAQVIIEDVDAQGVIKSWTPVDFLLKINPNLNSNHPPTCVISGVNPANPVNVIPGSSVSFTVTGNDSDPGDIVSLNSAGLPSGAIMLPALPVSGPSGVSSTFNWTPSAAQSGTYVVQFSATDQTNAQALCSVIINVQTNNAPNLLKNNVIQGTNVSVGELFNYEISFDTFATAGAAVGLQLVDTLPIEVDFVAVTTNGALSAVYDPVTRRVVWDFGTWPPLTQGPTNFLTVRLNGNAAGGSTIVNLASMVSSNLPPITTRDQNPRCPACPPGVTVASNVPPVALCRSITVSNDLGLCSATVTAAQVDAGSRDPEGGLLTLTLSPQGPYPVGTNLVTLTARDTNGASATCQATIVVIDAEPPQISCPADVTATNDVGRCSAAVRYITPMGTDNCAGATTVQIAGLPSGAAFPVGRTTNVFTVTDAAGHSATCSIVVTVNDTEPPMLQCPGTVVTNTTGGCTQVLLFAVTSSDNCGVTSQVCIPPSGSSFHTGISTVRCIATDGSGNAASCSFTVTVADTDIPQITCPANITLRSTGPTGAVASFTATATDNCPLPSVTCIPPSGNTFPVGTNGVICTATDASGNVASCGFTVTVLNVVGAMGTKQRCLEDLIVLRGSVTNRHDLEELDDAVEHLTRSLNPDWWLDDNHLQRKQGDKVFEEEKHAVHELVELLKDKKSSVPDVALQQLIECIVGVDRLLAQVAIDEAATAGVNPKKIAQAQKQLAEGDRDFTEGKFEESIDHYRHAWNEALHARIEKVHLATGKVQLDILGFAGERYVIQTSTNLADWVTLDTRDSDPDGVLMYEHTNPPAGPMRFYRILAP